MNFGAVLISFSHPPIIVGMAAQNGTAPFGAFNGTYPTPLAFVDPHQVHQLSLATYLHIGTTAVLIWDVVDNLRNDFRLFFSFKFGIPTFIYCVTRLSLLAYAIGRTVMLTTPAENCTAFEHSLNAFLIIFLAFTTLFFYIRVCVVYMMNPYIVSLFGISWLATVGMTTTLAQTFKVQKHGPYCYERVHGDLLVPTVVVLLVNEIFVYIAVTYKVYHLFLDKHLSLTRKLKLLTFGTSFPVLSSVILQDSQLYCLVIVLTKGFLILTLSGLQQPTNVMFIICHLVLVNILSCRVYRNIRMSVEHWEAQNGTSIEFRTSARNAELYQRRDEESISSSTIGGAYRRSSSPDPSLSRRSDLGVLETVPGSISNPSFVERTMHDEKFDSIYVVPRRSS